MIENQENPLPTFQITGYRRCDPSHEIYSWKHHDGREILFDVTLAKEICARRDFVNELWVKEIAGNLDEFLERTRDLDLERARTLESREPILILIWEGAGICIDGNHRICRALLQQEEMIQGHIIETAEEVAAVTICVFSAQLILHGVKN